MDLKQWCQLDEQIYIAEMDERYKQYAGLHYSEQMLERLAEMRIISAETFVNFFSRRSEEHTSELQSRQYLVCRLLLEKQKNNTYNFVTTLIRDSQSVRLYSI